MRVRRASESLPQSRVAKSAPHVPGPLRLERLPQKLPCSPNLPVCGFKRLAGISDGSAAPACCLAPSAISPDATSTAAHRFGAELAGISYSPVQGRLAVGRTEPSRFTANCCKFPRSLPPSLSSALRAHFCMREFRLIRSCKSRSERFDPSAQSFALPLAVVLALVQAARARSSWSCSSVARPAPTSSLIAAAKRAAESSLSMNCLTRSC